MKAILLAALSFIGFGASGKDYLDYYRTIASAQECVTAKAYEAALARYDSAFAAFSYNSPIDLYVAAQIAGFLGQPQRASAYILRGISFGLPLESVHQNPHLTHAVKIRGNAFPSSVDSCFSIYRGRINREARKAMIMMIRYDQAIIRRSGGSIYGTGGRTLKNEYIAVWDSLLREMVAGIGRWGFPAQKVIGTQNGDDSLFKVSPGNSFAWYILVHHGSAWPILKDLLPAELRKGNISPQMYGAIADFCNGHDDYSRMHYFSLRPCEEMIDGRRCGRAMRSHLADINEARDSIGLCPYQTFVLMSESTRAYRSWVKNGAAEATPAFDFQVSLNQW